MRDQNVHKVCIPNIEDPCAALRRASRAISHFYDQVLSPCGLRATQFIVLHAIGLRGEVAQWQLSKEYGISNETLSRRLSVLRRRGLIACRVGCEHPGERLYHLTSNGGDVLQKALPYWQRARERLRRAIGDGTEWDTMLKNIDQLCAFSQLAEHGKFSNILPPEEMSTAAIRIVIEPGQAVCESPTQRRGQPSAKYRQAKR